MTRGTLALTFVCLFAAANALVAQEPPAAAARERGGEAAKPEAAAIPRAEQSVTEHTIKLGGTPLKYRATAGTLLIRNDSDEPIAAIGYTAYTKDGADASQRPITFAYNGGPGSSSI